MTAPFPTLRLRIDEEALRGNWRKLDRLAGTARTGAAVKADCYGLGVKRCVPVLRDAGCRDFFVAHWSEVADVAAQVPPEQIAVLHGPTTQEEADYAQRTGVRPVINSLRQARAWQDAGGGACHLMVDTGINRLGISPQEVSDTAIGNLDVQLVMSHLACADEDSPKNGEQLDVFQDVIRRVPHQEASLANSAGIALGPAYRFDLTRPGLALYGGKPTNEFTNLIEQVAFPQAALISTRKIEAGKTRGYNATFLAKKDMLIGVVSLGYADGILRKWGGASFRYEGHELPILGKVSMDMIVIDLTTRPDLQEGDWVELPYDLPDAARQTSLSQYELLTVLGHRFAR